MAGRPRAFDRDEALENALLTFWKYGYDATSIALLTEAMGIGAPSLYAAFGDKRALFDEALGLYAKTYGAFMIDVFRGEADARATVARLLHEAAAMFAEREHPPGCLVISAATNCGPQSAAVAKRLRSFRAQTVRALEEKIEGARKHGALPKRTDAHALALFYSATLQGMSAQARDGASHEDLEAIADTALRAWPSA
ncbi:MAG TPA: TetR/AcrR family transcriptional regulator [Polyangiaceae bacterium]